MVVVAVAVLGFYVAVALGCMVLAWLYDDEAAGSAGFMCEGEVW